MKKKLMLVATMVGLLSLGACVDDKESPSVEAQRNAKTEQLKSIAALNSAEAEARKTLAAAEAALMAAEAEAIKVQNDLAKINIEIAKVQLEREQVALELEKEMNNIELQKALKQLENDLIGLENDKASLELQKAAIAAQLERQALDLEAELLKAQQSLLDAQQNLKNAQEGIDAKEKEKLEKLANEYSLAVNRLNSAKETLFSLKSLLIGYENGLISEEEYIAKEIAANEEEIAKNEASIAAWKKYTNYLSDYDKVKAEYEAKLLERDVVSDKYNNLAQAYYNVRYTYPSKDEVEESDFVVAYETLRASGWYSSHEVLTEYWYYTEYVSVEKILPSGQTLPPFGYNNLVTISAPNKEKLSTAKPYFQNQLDNYISIQKYFSEELKNAEKAVTDAKKAWEDAEKAENPNAGEIQFLADQYRKTLTDVELAKYNLDYYSEYVENSKKMLTYLDVLMSAEAYKKYTDLVTAHNKARLDAVTPKIDAYFVWQTYNYGEYMIITEEYNALYNILYTGYNTAEQINQSIKFLEESIESLKERNQDLQKELAKEKADTAQLIEYRKAEIEAQESLISVLQVYVDNAKSALDAAMPKAEAGE